MAELYTGNLEISYGWDLGEDGWKNGMDTNMLKLDSLVFLIVLDKDLTAPPGSNTAGDTYIVGASPTGGWAGEQYNIAYYTGSSWQFYTPKNGWRCLVADEGYATYEYQSSAWSANTTKIGISTFLDMQIDGTTTFDGTVDFNETVTFDNTVDLGAATTVTGTNTFSISGTATLAFVDGAAVTTGTTNGTKFGTTVSQKLGFWDTTPVVQPADADQATIIPATATTEEIGTLLVAIRTALFDIGIIKGSA